MQKRKPYVIMFVVGLLIGFFITSHQPPAQDPIGPEASLSYNRMPSDKVVK